MRFLATLASALVALAILAAPARAGHELPFYPGYYPQEIRVEALTPAAAVPLLRRSTLHAYVGADPFGGGRLPANVSAMESLAGYVVATPAAATPGTDGTAARCASALAVARAAGAARVPGFVAHAYPVTPYHGDYLEHFDLAEASRRAVEGAAAGAAPRLAARGPLAERLLPAWKGGPASKGDATIVEEIDLQGLLAPYLVTAGGSFSPPWLKEGWFHAYLLQASAMADPTARRAADQLFHRLVTGVYEGPAARAVQRRVLPGHREHRVGFAVRVRFRHLRAHRQAEGLPVERLDARGHGHPAHRGVESGRGFHRSGRTPALGRARRPRVPARALRRGPGPAPRGAGLGGGGRDGGRGDPRGRAAPGAG